MNVTECIQQDYMEWQRGDVIAISAGTGKGKSYFVQQIYSKYVNTFNKKILYLVPRKLLKKQIEEALKKDGICNIDVMTYQSYEALFRKKLAHNDVKRHSYQYIVCDEFHYFFNDAGFNDFTDISMELFLSNEKAITILLSATGDVVMSYIKRFYPQRKIISYELDSDYSYVTELNCYSSNDQLYEVMDWLVENNKKTMIFIQSAKRAYELYQKYESYSNFVCGERSEFYQYVDKTKVDNILQKEKFDSLFLISTSVLDVGVNIIDKELNNIIIDMHDINVLKQCLGRKRLVDDEDNVALAVKNINNNQLGGLISKEKKRVQQGKLFIKDGVEALIKRNYRKPLDNSLFYLNEKGVLQLNLAKYIYAGVTLQNYERWVNKTNGYINEVKNQINHKKSIIYWGANKKEVRMELLKEHCGKEFLSKLEYAPLVESLNFRRNGKQLKSLKEINKELTTEGYPYIFENYKATREIEGVKKQYRIWCLKELRQNERQAIL